MLKIILIPLIFINIYANENFTLKEAIKISKKNSFTQKNIKEDIKKNRLSQNYNKNYYTPNVFLKLQVGKERNFENTVDDNFTYFEVKNTLYLKKISILENEFKNNIKIKTILLNYSIKQRKIKVMRLFFDSLLTTYNKQYTLEVLALKAIRNIKANDYYSTGEISDIKILQTKTDMQFASAKKAQVDANYENTRLKLAYFLNTKIEKVYNLEIPNLKYYWNKKILPEEKLYELAFKNDLILKKLITSLNAINKKINSYKNDININLASTLKYGVEPQKMNSTNDTRWEARINMSIPLYDINTDDKIVSFLLIDKNKIKNDIAKYKLDLQQTVYDLMINVKKYKKLHLAYETQVEYRNLYLERARVNYELDRQSDLGDSMVQLSLAELQYAQNEYNYVIAYEMLQLIVGEK